MRFGPENADDSCLANQTVGSTPTTAVSTPALPPSDEKDARPLNPISPLAHDDDDDHGHAKGAQPPPAGLEVKKTSSPAGPMMSTPAPGDPEAPSPPAPPTGTGQHEDDTFPEGGLEAWLVVFGSFCAMLSVYGLINSAAVFESYFSEHQLAGQSPSTVGWIFSVYLFVVFFAGIQVGPVFDHQGPRALVAVGSVLTVASQMLLGLCTREFPLPSLLHPSSASSAPSPAG